MKKGTTGSTFLIVGIVFLAIGVSGQGNLVGIGAAFLAIGIAYMVKEKRAGGSK